MQLAITLARVLINAVGLVVPTGAVSPGDVPVAEFENWFARVKAEASAVASVADEPTEDIELMNGARAFTAATVVTSLTEINVDEVKAEQVQAQPFLPSWG